MEEKCQHHFISGINHGWVCVVDISSLLCYLIDCCSFISNHWFWLHFLFLYVLSDLRHNNFPAETSAHAKVCPRVQSLLPTSRLHVHFINGHVLNFIVISNSWAEIMSKIFSRRQIYKNAWLSLNHISNKYHLNTLSTTIDGVAPEDTWSHILIYWFNFVWDGLIKHGTGNRNDRSDNISPYHGSDNYVHATPESVVQDLINYGSLDSNLSQYIQVHLSISVGQFKLLL